MELHKCPNTLRSLREEIATFCIVKCRMSHERVLRDDASGLPVICRFPEGSYQRVGLCTPEIRAKRLGCSHTSARIKLDDAINVLSVNNTARELLRSELAWLNNAIHLLDHRKGEAEKRLARMLYESQRADESEDHFGVGIGASAARENVRLAEDEVCELERLHDEYVELAGRLRDRVVNEIDELLIRGYTDQ